MGLGCRGGTRSLIWPGPFATARVKGHAMIYAHDRGGPATACLRARPVLGKRSWRREQPAW
jgi:hypothetical protein